MKKLITLGLVMALISGCHAAVKYDYDMAFEAEAPESYKDAAIKNETPYIYEDKLAKFLIFLAPQSFLLSIKNKTDKTIQLVWNEASITDFSGEADKVLTEDMRVIDKFNALNSTVIPKGGQVIKMFWPASRVHSSRYGILKSVWSEDEKMAERIVDKYMTFVLPIATEDKKVEYTFRFKINKVTVKID